MTKLFALLALFAALSAQAFEIAHPQYSGVSINTSSTNIGTGAFVEVVAAGSLNRTVNAIQITNGTSGAIYLATGAASSEVISKYVIPPGVNPIIPFPIAKSTRLSYKSVSGTLNSGLVTINFF